MAKHRRVTKDKNDEAKLLYPREWSSLRSAIARCDDKSDEDYGGRGVAVCKEWRSATDGFVEFLKHIRLRRPEGRVLGRIDKDKGYVPGNVRWMDRSEVLRGRACSREE